MQIRAAAKCLRTNSRYIERIFRMITMEIDDAFATLSGNVDMIDDFVRYVQRLAPSSEIEANLQCGPAVFRRFLCLSHICQPMLL